MKATGIIRKVDELGRVVLPVELRKSLKINEKDPIEIFVEDEYIILKKHVSSYECNVTGKIARKPIILGNGKIVLSEDGARIVLNELLARFGKETT